MRTIVLLTALIVGAAAVAVPTGQSRQPLLGVVNANALFDDSVVHDIRLTVNTTDWATLKERYLENTYYPADLRWQEKVVRTVGIRSRGTGSRSPIKPGLTVNFGRYVTNQTFLGLAQVVLRNNTQDPSNMRERLSMLLFARLGLPASREAYARLYVNEDYVGLYTIVEAIDDAFLRRTFDDDGGYLFSYEYPSGGEPYYFEYRGSNPGLYVPLPFKPQTHTGDPQPEVVARLVEAINLPSDTVFRSEIARYFDLAGFVRHVAVEQFVQDDDGLLGDYGMNNAYLYRPQQTTVFSFITWDKSNAFTSGFTRSIWHNITDVPPALRNRAMTRAMSYSDLVSLYLNTVLECVRSAAELSDASDGRGWLEREIDREYSQIRVAARADPVKPYTNEQFEASIEELRLFARERGATVAAEVRAASSGGAGVNRR
jgi:hypothetical protein